MAQLNDSVVQGSLRVTDTIYTTDFNMTASKTAAYVLASPASASGAPSFRALATTDIPVISITAGTTGTLTIGRGGTGITTATAHYILMGPTSGNATAPTWRSITASDLPAIGNISNTGTITTSTSSTIANGDAIVISTSANSGVLTRTSITFDGNTETDYLTKKGTWKTPPNDKVLQIGATTDKEYCALFKSTGNDTSSVTSSVAFANGSGKLITGNFSSGRLSAASFRVSEKATLQWNTTSEALEFVF